MDDPDQLIEIIESLRNEGFKIEMDDFGCGYSSLNMLADVPVDILKLDMRFIQNLKSSTKQETMIRLVMDIAKYLDMQVVAEGVEEKSQVDFLRSVGCDIIQGYYFSKPLPEDEFVKHVLNALKK
jgi:EAL domain-containing protein (putative c-di-GMP-specific phosphodiesterase class I)